MPKKYYKALLQKLKLFKPNTPIPEGHTLAVKLRKYSIEQKALALLI
jgi:hypothetical protein